MRVSVQAGQLHPDRAGRYVVFEALAPSSRDPGTGYRVARLADGTWTCTCPGCSYGARSDGLCRHIDGKREEYERRLTLAFLLC